MKVESTANIERIGVSFVQLAFEKMAYIFREQPTSDYGIDAHVEIVNYGQATGRLLAVQIKSGSSWFKEKTKRGIVFREDLAHLEYWLNHSLSVIIVLYDPTTETAYWQVVNEKNVIRTKKAWKIEVPLEQTVTESFKQTFEELAGKPISTKNSYAVLSLSDVSHGTAKRYSANILISESLAKTQIYRVIQEVTEDLKSREYYRSDLIKQRWKGKPTQVIFLFIYQTLDDIRTTSWICRSLWIDENLPSQFAPIRHKGEDIGFDTVVDWSENYEFMRRIREQHSRTKEDYLEELERILKLVKGHVEQAIKLVDEHKSMILTSKAYISEMVELESQITKLYMQAGDIGLAPLECKDLAERFQSLMGYAHNIVLPFSERGLRTWQESNRQYLVRRAIENYQKDMIRLEFELEKVH